VEADLMPKTADVIDKASAAFLLFCYKDRQNTENLYFRKSVEVKSETSHG
jgi:hypothetical protein